MKHGSEWYKRDPLAYLGGVQGLTAKQHAVYSVVLDLIYQHGGAVNNDPRWISGWIADMGSAAVRKTILDLVSMGKLTVEGGQLSQSRAKTEAKTRETIRKTEGKPDQNRCKSAVNPEGNRCKSVVNPEEKQTENSSKNGAGCNENKDLGQASSCQESPLEKRREEKNIYTPLSPRKTGGSKRFIGVPEGTLRILYGDKADD